jgi:hypothetical protein
MPATDLIHNAVKNALVKDGWVITADPYVIEYEEVILFADLGAERPIAAERAGRKIVVEVKSFLHPSPMQDFKNALGQYILYKSYLRLTAPERKVYLAVSDDVYAGFFEQKAIQVIVQEQQLFLLVVNVEAQEIGQWID